MKKEYTYGIIGLVIGLLSGYYYSKNKTEKTSFATGKLIKNGKGISAGITNDDVCVGNCVGSGWSTSECRDSCGVKLMD